jgi:hypothetical protein
VESFRFAEKDPTVARKRVYPPEFRAKILELVRSGKNVSAIAREYELAQEQEAIEVLLGEAKAWEDARRIRDYVEAILSATFAEPSFAALSPTSNCSSSEADNLFAP